MIPIPYIVGGVAVAAGGGFLLYKSNKTTTQTTDTVDEKAKQAQINSGAAVAAQQQDATGAVVMDGTTEEYNLKREEYRKITGTYPPKSWSAAMIDSWIEEQNKKNDAIAKYVSLVSANAQYTSQADTSEMTYSEIMRLIDKTGNEIKNNKEKERVQKLANTAKNLAENFRKTLLAPNYYNLAMKGQNAWDASTLGAMKALTTEGKRYCEYYFEQAGPVKLPGYFNQAKSRWKEYRTIASCILTSNTNTGRTNASLATTVRTAFAGVSPLAPTVGADGSLQHTHKQTITDRLIALNIK